MLHNINDEFVFRAKIDDSNTQLYFTFNMASKVMDKHQALSLKKYKFRRIGYLKICLTDYLTPTLLLHKDLNILMVQDIFKLYVLKSVYKQHNMFLPRIFDNIYTTNDEMHLHNTR